MMARDIRNTLVESHLALQYVMCVLNQHFLKSQRNPQYKGILRNLHPEKNYRANQILKHTEQRSKNVVDIEMSK